MIAEEGGREGGKEKLTKEKERERKRAILPLTDGPRLPVSIRLTLEIVRGRGVGTKLSNSRQTRRWTEIEEVNRPIMKQRVAGGVWGERGCSEKAADLIHESWFRGPDLAAADAKENARQTASMSIPVCHGEEIRIKRTLSGWIRSPGYCGCMVACG